MKPTNLSALVVCLSLIFCGVAPLAHAELVRQQVKADAITPEPSQAAAPAESEEEELVIVRKKKPEPKRRVVFEEVDAAPLAAQTAALPQASAAPVAQQQVAPEVTAPKQNIGGAIDSTIDAKMDGVKQQFQEKIVKMLDRIKISVDEAPPAPTTSTIVEDKIASASAAPQTEASVPAVVADPVAAAPAATSVQAKDELEESTDSFKGRTSLFPIVGVTNIKSDAYTIDPRYTAGLGLEVEVAKSLAFVASYTYSQYNIGLANSNNYYNYYSPTGLVNVSNLRTLTYNQNLVDVGMRLYLMPKSSRLRLFVGGGVGYSKAYLNYDQATLNTYAANQYAPTSGELSDYEVNSYVGQLEAGGEIQITKLLSIGLGFKYDNILSSQQNNSLNNNAFVYNAGGTTATSDKSIAGGSISQSAFYSVLGSVKLSF